MGAEMQDTKNTQEDCIDQYLRGRLSADELAKFEIKMLEDPHFFAQVQQAEIMHDALKSEKAQLESRPEKATNGKVLPFGAWIKQPMSLAASVLIAFGFLLSGSNYLTQMSEFEVQEGVALNSVINLGQLRSSNDELVLSASAHLLQIDVGIRMDGSAYSAKLTDESGVQREYRVVPDGNGIVRLLTPVGLNGLYQLTVEADTTPQPVASYTLRFE